jgi:hypothetical protein
MDATPLQQAAATDFDDLQPLGPDDENCINELRAVLAKHNRLDRFGIFLLHQHFPIGDDEVLKEFCDPESRTLTIKPVKRDELASEQTIDTMWNLATNRAVQKCIFGKCE